MNQHHNASKLLEHLASEIPKFLVYLDRHIIIKHTIVANTTTTVGRDIIGALLDKLNRYLALFTVNLTGIHGNSSINGAIDDKSPSSKILKFIDGAGCGDGAMTNSDCMCGMHAIDNILSFDAIMDAFGAFGLITVELAAFDGIGAVTGVVSYADCVVYRFLFRFFLFFCFHIFSIFCFVCFGVLFSSVVYMMYGRIVLHVFGSNLVICLFFYGYGETVINPTSNTIAQMPYDKNQTITITKIQNID